MPRKRLPPDDPQKCLKRARRKLTQARRIIPDVFVLCFDAHDAAKNAIKAVLVNCRLKLPRIDHPLDLLWHLEQNGAKIPKYVREAGQTYFAMELRYQGVVTGLSCNQRQHRKMIRIAENVIRWASRQIGQR